ncbi:MAG TPA: hypothetical protein PLW68_05395 [Casimicrobiaceae bacterium]|nr:hypothetical protein [Casimicrobiaceae bacterium]
MKKLLLLMLVCWSGFASAQQLYFLQDNNGQFYTINTTTGAATLVATISAVTSNTIGLTESPTPGVLYGTTYTQLISFNVNGTGVTTIGPSSAEALGWCITANVLYGAINGNFFSINPTTGAQTPLTGPGADVEGLACDHPNNVLYGIVRNTGVLMRYTPGTDTWATVGNTGIAFLDPGLAMDVGAGVLYAVNATNGSIYSINPTTAAATLVGSMGIGNVGGGLAFTGGSAPVAAPSGIPASSPASLAAMMLACVLLGAWALRRRHG